MALATRRVKAEYFEDLANERRRMYFGSASGQLLDPDAVVNLHTSHTLYTSTDLVDLLLSLSSAEVHTNETVKFLRFGAARRLTMVRHAYLALVSTASPKRTNPLAEEEVADLTRDINVIYFNIVGILDNLAWALLYEKAPGIASTVKPQEIGLFRNCVTKQPIFVALRPLLNLHSEWQKSVKTKRDPVAHRIPLSVPPAVLTPEEEEEYKRRWSKWEQHAANLELDEAEGALDSLNGLGKFVPHFWHEDVGAALPVYPTVSDDLQHLKELSYGVLTFLQAPPGTQ